MSAGNFAEVRSGDDPQTSADTLSNRNIRRGVCHVLLAYDVGLSIRLDEAERQIAAVSQRATVRRKRKTPTYFEYRPAPLRYTISIDSIDLGPWRTEAAVDLVVYDFGAVSATYRLPLSGPLDALLGLAEALYDNPVLLRDSRRRVDDLLSTIAPAVQRPSVADFVEDYVVYHIEEIEPRSAPPVVVAQTGPDLAQVLRAESERLSPEMIEDALSCRIAFGADDLTLIDWNATLLLGSEMDDVLAVLEYANVELLEMRYLDEQLDNALAEAYEAFSRRARQRLRPLVSRATDLRRVAELQLDSALLFEGVGNALKLLGDQYLAKVYQLAVRRLHIDDWDASILRKLSTLESIYQKISDQQSNRRMEVLEWIIIVLIAVSIALPFVVSTGK